MPPFVLANSTVASQVSKYNFPLSPLSNRFVWLHSSGGILTTKDALNFLHLVPISVDRASSISKHYILPTHSFDFWRLMYQR